MACTNTNLGRTNMRTRFFSLKNGVWQLGTRMLNVAVLLLLIIAAGCATRPVGADRVTTRTAYEQVDQNAINSGKPSTATVSLLHRYNLDALAAKHADEAVRKLHELAVETGDRDLLFALAELSYVAGDQIRTSLKAWDPRDAREFYLGSAVYAYLYLFGDGNGAKPDAFDRRFRVGCDLYNYGLGWGLTERRGTNAIAELKDGLRRLPVGEIDLHLDATHFPWPLDVAEGFLIADQFVVRGLSVRNRDPGIGAPLIAVGHKTEELRLRRAFPATVFLRLHGSLAEISSGNSRGDLELYAGYDDTTIEVAGEKVPLENDLTAPAALMLNQSFAWKVERLQFLRPGEGLKSQLLASEPYRPGKIPLVFVHGTFSSPVWWAEMVNTLRADPEIRSHYQIWQFLYSSSKPVVVSAVELRDALTERLKKLDPEGKDPALRDMVLVGHSQGGLLCKLCVTDTGDKLWRVFSDKQPEELNLSTNQLAMVRRYCFFQALPFVKRVIFICTPHRGSFMAKRFVRNLVRRLISAPSSMVQKSKELFAGTDESKLPSILSSKKMPTSLDGMAPDNPFALALAEIPPAPGITAHSIIAIDGNEQPPDGDDGVVKYTSAHVDYAESEFIVRSFHSCQDKPETIEEVRRILHEHLDSLPAQAVTPVSSAPGK
jgi:pimeloyl-ACP methyl ester carboxylesterase